jgi:predicted nucleic acid-binding protein
VELVYDAGALIGAERGSVDLLALHDAALRAGVLPMVPVAVLGQVWRGTSRQARLSRLLAGCQVLPLDETTAREGGVLCGRANTADIVDAVVVVLASRYHAGVVTSDRSDLEILAAALPVKLTVYDV